MMKTEKVEELRKLRAETRELEIKGYEASAMLALLQSKGGKLTFAAGTYRFRLAGVTGTNTAGNPVLLIRSWQRALDRRIEVA